MKTDAKLLKKAMIDPDRVFDNPSELLEDDRFSAEDKLKILDSWAVDANGLLRAEEENMTPDTVRPKAATLLQLINKTRMKIEESSDTSELSRAEKKVSK